jgi:hypothetical protein
VQPLFLHDYHLHLIGVMPVPKIGSYDFPPRVMKVTGRSSPSRFSAWTCRPRPPRALRPNGRASWQILDPLQRRRQPLDPVKHLLLREARPALIVLFENAWIDSEAELPIAC